MKAELYGGRWDGSCLDLPGEPPEFLYLTPGGQQLRNVLPSPYATLLAFPQLSLYLLVSENPSGCRYGHARLSDSDPTAGQTIPIPKPPTDPNP